jgi:acetate kinase
LSSLNQIPAILAINSGSSSLKFKLFSLEDPSRQLVTGKITGIGSTESSFSVAVDRKPGDFSHKTNIESVAKAATFIVDWLKQQINNYKIAGIGHRIRRVKKQKKRSANAKMLAS